MQIWWVNVEMLPNGNSLSRNFIFEEDPEDPGAYQKVTQIN